MPDELEDALTAALAMMPGRVEEVETYLLGMPHGATRTWDGLLVARGEPGGVAARGSPGLWRRVRRAVYPGEYGPWTSLRPFAVSLLEEDLRKTWEEAARG